MSEYFRIMVDGQPFASSNNADGLIDCTITKEINKSGSANFTVLPTHPMWDSFHRMKTIVDIYIWDKNVFHGRVTDCSYDFFKQKSVKCEGALAWFIDNFKPMLGSEENPRYLDNMKPYRSVVYWETIGFNTLIEPDKWFYLGVVEPRTYANDLIPIESHVYGKIFSTSDGVTLEDNGEWTCSTEFVPVSQNTNYRLYVKEYKDEYDVGVITARVYYYDANKTLLSYTDLDAPAIWIGDANASYIRVAGKCSQGDLFSLVEETGSDYFPETDGSRTWDGGTYADFLTQWLVDSWFMMIRARYDPSTYHNYLDVLNPGRSQAVATIEFEKNMIDLKSEQATNEPFSVVVPTFKKKSYTDESNFGYLEIPKAIALYGYIVKPVEFGEKPKTAKEIAKFKEQEHKLLEIYDDVLPDKFTITALDDGVIFDNNALSIIDVGDAVRVVSEPHGIDKILICQNMTLNLFSPENNSYTIGTQLNDIVDNKIKTLTESFTKNKKDSKK